MQDQDADAREQAQDDDDEELPPAVILATAGELGARLPEGIAAASADRPIWFLLAAYSHLVGVFLRHRETKMPREASDAILSALRRFSKECSDDLQRNLGITDALQVGFHTSATLQQVRDSFEEDGFEVVGTIREGRVVAHDPP